MLSINKIIIVIAILLFSCSSPEYTEAINTYEQAKKDHNITKMVAALEILARLAPKEFQTTLDDTQSAQQKINIAKRHLNDGNYYLAYIASHESYRNIPSLDSRKILIETGKLLAPLLQAQLEIEKAYEYRPLTLIDEYKRYSSSSIYSWNLVNVNAIVKQLSRSTHALESALRHTTKNSVNSLIPGFDNWKAGIEKQLADAYQIQNFLPNIAKHYSAQALLTIEKKLTTESIHLLSLIRPSMALENAMPLFSKAQNDYEPTQNIVENISLALNLSQKDIHSTWYDDWQEIEYKTLFPPQAFERYPIETKHRKQTLKKYISPKNFVLPEINHQYSQISKFSQAHPKMTELLTKLKRDKSLL